MNARVSGLAKRVSSCVLSVLGLAREIWADPLARQIILWILTRRLPSGSGLARACSGLPRSPKCMSLPEGLAEVRRLGLRCPLSMRALTVEQMDGNWNGMGPDVWPEWLRRLVDAYAGFIMICSLPHDMAYVFDNDGTYCGWSVTQNDWEYNSGLCLADAARTSGWWQRRRQAFIAALVVAALRAGAYAAWRSAYARREASKGRSPGGRSPKA